MISLDELIARPEVRSIRLRIRTAGPHASPFTSDALFHAPLLALTILVICRARREGLVTTDLTTWTLGTLVKHSEVLRIKRATIQWSVPLRTRCVEALMFLESAGMVTVHEVPARTVFMSSLGHEFLRKLEGDASETGVLVRELERAERGARQSGVELL